MRTNTEIARELAQITDEKEREVYFKKLVKEFDKDEKNNDRKHFRSERRHSFDITNMDSDYDPDDMSTHVPPLLVNLCKPRDWEDIMFSESAEELPELVTDRALSRIISKLPHAQKEALYYRVIKGYTAEEIAELKGVSARNVRKLYERALEHIREDYLPIIKFKRKLETDEKYGDIARECDIYTTIAERKFLDRCEVLPTETEKTA